MVRTRIAAKAAPIDSHETMLSGDAERRRTTVLKEDLHMRCPQCGKDHATRRAIRLAAMKKGIVIS